MSFHEAKTIKHKVSLIRRRLLVVKRDGIKYLFKTDRQIYNRFYSVKRKEKYGSGKLSNGKKRKLKLIKKRGRRCEWCREKFKPEDLTIDHIIEISNGGSNRQENLRLLCLPCHILRHQYDVKVINTP